MMNNEKYITAIKARFQNASEGEAFANTMRLLCAVEEQEGKEELERKKREDALLLNAALEQEEEEREHYEG